MGGRVDNVISKYTVNLTCHTNDINIFVNTVHEMRYNQFISQWKTDLQENGQNWTLTKLLIIITYTLCTEQKILESSKEIEGQFI